MWRADLEFSGETEKNQVESQLVYPASRPWFEADTFRTLSRRWNSTNDTNKNVAKPGLFCGSSNIFWTEI